MKQTTNPFPPTEVELDSLYTRWITNLKDYSTATGVQRTMCEEELIAIYNETLSLSGVKNVEHNTHYRLITHRPIEKTLILSNPNKTII